MAITSINPYLLFNGTAEKAIRLYESALGAKADQIMRFGDAAGPDAPPEVRNRVMHCALTIDGQVVMASDGRPDVPVPASGNVNVSLNFDDEADMDKRFQALSAGGQVTMPLADQFWGARFGMLIDAYGVEWMFNCQKKK